MKKKIAVFLAAIIILLSSTVAYADFGDYAGGSDWGYSDFGGYDSGWDSGYDYYDYGYGYGYGNDYYYSGSSGEFGLVEIIITVVIVIIVIIAVIGRNAIGKNVSGRKSVNIPTQNTAPLINDIAGLKERDPLFSESKFLGEAANLYIRMQDAWSARDLSPIRPHLTEDLFAKSDRQIQGYISRGQTNHVERVSVLNTRIAGCTKDAQNDIITVEILSRISDYITDDRTGEVIRGDRNRELFMTYHWTFIRTLGKTTSEEEAIDDRHCPSCGAPIDLNRSAVCEYCGAVCVSAEHDWVLSDIKGISQRS